MTYILGIREIPRPFPEQFSQVLFSTFRRPVDPWKRPRLKSRPRSGRYRCLNS